MLGKLLKYDIKSILRYWWIIAISTLGAAVLGGGAMRFMIEFNKIEDPSVILSLTYISAFLQFALCIFAIVASFILTYILVFYRFYKNFFTDEGYLTFTLPVSRKKLFLSKTINALLFTTLQAIVFAVGIAIIFLFISPKYFVEAMGYFSDMFLFIWDEIGSPLWEIVYIILIVVGFAFSVFFGINFFHLCITIGSILAKKHKLLASIGIYYGANTIVSIFGEIFVLILAGVAFEPLSNIANTPVSPNVTYALIALILLMGCAIVATLAFTVYSITQQLIDRRLNLA